ncbi:hypothetical protein F4861DRAFT_536688 [Xylaria intraflava]|nr:hypothetical protein F4861DRAFT_536688 [Xylaria intraflava]
MPADKRGDQHAALDYGASVARENVDFAEDYSAARPGNRDRALMDRLKDALRPGDARRYSAGDDPRDSRHGGVEGSRNEREEAAHRGGLLDELGCAPRAREGSGGSSRGGILEGLHFGHEQSSKPQDDGGAAGPAATTKKKKKGGSARVESYRDSTDTTKADENRVPGNFYQAIRDDFGG